MARAFASVANAPEPQIRVLSGTTAVVPDKALAERPRCCCDNCTSLSKAREGASPASSLRVALELA